MKTFHRILCFFVGHSPKLGFRWLGLSPQRGVPSYFHYCECCGAELPDAAP